MRVLIVGAGEVGSNIAARLAPVHDVVVVDVDPEVVDRLTYSLDVLAIEGDGSSLGTLREAGIADTTMLIACTDDDETNLVTCGTAATVSDTFTIARVRKAKFLETWKNFRGAFGVDVMLATNILTAESIVRVIGLPAALDVDLFAEGIVQTAEFAVTERSPVANQTVAEADQWEALTFAALVRDGAVTIPSGETVIEAGDRVIVIGGPASVEAFAESAAPDDTSKDVDDIVIVGGSKLGYQTAALLVERGFRPQLIEQDATRARELAEKLPKASVLEQDGADVEFLRDENVDQADVVITALESDEKNFFVALLAKNIGANRAIAIVENGSYTEFFEQAGVDVAINPREETSEEIIRQMQEREVENLSIIEERQAGVLEVEVGEESVLTSRPIREAVADLPSGVVVGAIARSDELVVPRGDTVIAPDDHVVLFVEADVIDEVTAIV
ncbi:Trk system potassium transporter TrkA [Halomicrococcus gelatinilyticus]|uniref:Trk system potassium transporter TrkA n=1 Tax=Halomicrococcus gelatinilyticus TaxID=1702103 RepID=UPI002E0E9D33